MAFTTNYNWEVADVGADFGSWGGITNAAFQLIDTKMKSVDDRLAAAEAELSGPLNVVGNGTFTGNVTAAQLASTQPSAPNDVLAPSAFFSAGTDGVLGQLYLQTALYPSATAGNRYARIQVGDGVALRKLGVLASQVYVGTNAPAFAGSEMLRVQGSVYVDTTVTASNFLGSGAGLLTNSVPFASVVGLTPFQTATNSSIDALTANKSNVGHTHTTGEVAGLDAAIAGKANTSHTHDASQITGGQFAWARVIPPGSIGYATQANTNGIARSTVMTSAYPWTSGFTNFTDVSNGLLQLQGRLADLVNDLAARGLI